MLLTYALEREADKCRKITGISYYNLPEKLPLELLNMILIHLDTKSLAAIGAAPPDEFKLEARDTTVKNRGSYKPKLEYLWRSYESRVESYSSLFYEKAIDCQFPLVDQIFTRKPAYWSFCPNFSLWGDMSSKKAFEFLEYWDNRTEVGVRAIQRGLPEMRQTNLIRFYLLHLWFWYGASSRCPPARRTQEGWNYFASLPLEKQQGILNFFDNLGYCLRKEFPVRYPSYQYGIHGAPNPCHRLCPNCARRFLHSKKTGDAIWRIPKYIPAELEALGVADLVAKQLAMGKLAQLYELLNTKERQPLTSCEEERILNFFRRGMANGRFWFWHPENGPALFKSSSHFVMRFDLLTYEVWVHGARGAGTIELRLHSSRPQMSNWSRLFEDAMVSQQVKQRPLEVGDWIRSNVVSPGYVIDRIPYWCWTHWRLGIDENIGLERLLFCDAPW